MGVCLPLAPICFSKSLFYPSFTPFLTQASICYLAPAWATRCLCVSCQPLWIHVYMRSEGKRTKWGRREREKKVGEKRERSGWNGNGLGENQACYVSSKGKSVSGRAQKWMIQCGCECFVVRDVEIMGCRRGPSCNNTHTRTWPGGCDRSQVTEMLAFDWKELFQVLHAKTRRADMSITLKQVCEVYCGSSLCHFGVWTDSFLAEVDWRL